MNTIGLIVYRAVVKLLPETRCYGLKRWMLRRAGAEVGRGVRICSSAFIAGSGQLVIGDDTWVGHQAMLIATSTIRIGCRVDIAPRVSITTGTHRVDLTGDRIAGEGLSHGVVIGDGCWICMCASILPGVSIGDMSLVAAGAVVTQNFESRSRIGGVPAKAM